MVVPVLQAYLDESADEKTRYFFCVGAFLTSESEWRIIQEKWVKRICENGIKYFHAADCKAVCGPFQMLRRLHED